MIEPDKREMLWFEINKYLSIDSDAMPHYFSNLFDKCKILFATEPKKPFCMNCKAYSIIAKDDEYFCSNQQDNEEPHDIQMLSPNEVIDLMVKEIELTLEEPSGYVMDIYDIEEHLFRRTYNSFFETKNGEITKSKVMKMMYFIKRFIISELILLRDKIRFTNSYQATAMASKMMEG